MTVYTVKIMKRILCVIESLGPGGAERQMAYLASFLKEAGQDVELWTYYPDDFYKFIIEEKSVPYRYIEKARNRIRRLFVLSKEIRRYHPDLIISYLDTCSMCCCLIKAMGGRFSLAVSERCSTIKSSFYESLKFRLYRFANHIISNSFTQSDYIRNNYPSLCEKVKTIINYTDVEIFSPNGRVGKRNPELVSLIGIGRVSKQKNILRLVEAIKIVKSKGYSIELKWYGGVTDSEVNKELHSTINLFQLNNIVSLRPPTKDVLSLYRNSDVLCLPSLYEGFPNVICEAMSCGLPIICSNVCDNAFLVEDGINGILFNPKDPENIADAIIRYIECLHSDRKEVGIRNREKIMRLCSKESFVKSYMELT